VASRRHARGRAARGPGAGGGRRIARRLPGSEPGALLLRHPAVRGRGV